MLPGTFWLKVAWSPPGWRRPKTLALAASEPDLSQRLPVKREPTKVPRGWHGRNRRSFMAGRRSTSTDRSGLRPAPSVGSPADRGLAGECRYHERPSQPWAERAVRSELRLREPEAGLESVELGQKRCRQGVAELVEPRLDLGNFGFPLFFGDVQRCLDLLRCHV